MPNVFPPAPARSPVLRNSRPSHRAASTQRIVKEQPVGIRCRKVRLEFSRLPEQVLVAPRFVGVDLTKDDDHSIDRPLYLNKTHLDQTRLQESRGDQHPDARDRPVCIVFTGFGGKSSREHVGERKSRKFSRLDRNQSGPKLLLTSQERARGIFGSRERGAATGSQREPRRRKFWTPEAGARPRWRSPSREPYWFFFLVRPSFLPLGSLSPSDQEGRRLGFFLSRRAP